jgi:ABC-type transport system involved in multi-copper enzyme maturation permease subunit
MKTRSKILMRWLIDQWLLTRLALRLQLGRRFWIAPLLVLGWPAFQSIRLVFAEGAQGFNAADAQNVLIGFPLVVLAIGLGVRIIAGEIEQRTLEVTYTVPGGARRVWIAKLVAMLVPLAMAETLLAAVTVIFFTSFPWTALYGALQGAVCYMALAMALGALFRSEIAAALAVAVILGLNAMFEGGLGVSRISPLFNPLAVRGDVDATEILAWTVQNRIGYTLAIIALVALACARAERREKLLSS